MALNVFKLANSISGRSKADPSVSVHTLAEHQPQLTTRYPLAYGDVQLRQWLFIWYFVNGHIDVSSESSMVDDSVVCDRLAIVVLLKPGSAGFQRVAFQPGSSR
ncbi:unnamed protein product [Sphagnum balticum]